MLEPFSISGKRVALLGSGSFTADIKAHLASLGALVEEVRHKRPHGPPDLLIDIEDPDEIDDSWPSTIVDDLQALRQALASDSRPSRLLVLANDRVGRVQGRARAALGRSLARELAKHVSVNIAAPAEGQWRELAPAVSALAQFLLSPHADFVIGHTFRLARPPRPMIGRTADAVAGQAIIVTGAAGGIGRAITDLLGEHGANVHDADIMPGCRHQIDLSCPNACRDLVQRVRDEERRLDAVINVAGWLGRRPFVEADPDYQRQTLGVNFAGQHHLCAAALAEPDFAESGVIVNFASGAGLAGGLYGAATYGFAKGASIGLTESLAEAWAGRGVCINALVPGSIDTPMLRQALSKAQLDQLAAGVLAGRLGRPQDVAGIILFLVGAGGRIFHGHTFIADGGGLLR